MSTVDITVDVSHAGPLFDGRAQHAVEAFERDARAQVAQQSLADWQLNLDRSIRHPTPYYETQVHTQDMGDRQVVDDRGIIYGPWLEGVGSRNRTTRFKGYFSLRRAYQGMQAKVGPLIERVIRRYIEEMNR